ncbi:unnamed protein product [Chrysoparadoxa australica]
MLAYSSRLACAFARRLPKAPPMAFLVAPVQCSPFSAGSTPRGRARPPRRGSKGEKKGAQEAPACSPEVSMMAAKNALKRVREAVRPMEEDKYNLQEGNQFKVQEGRNSLFIDLGPKFGCYQISYNSDHGQLEMMSPRSGAFCYRWCTVKTKWVGVTDGHDFEGMLTRDLIQQAHGVPNW